MMKRMGKEMQVIAITHLPQVAAKGDSHFKVYKTDNEERTVSHVRRLSDEERIRSWPECFPAQQSTRPQC